MDLAQTFARLSRNWSATDGAPKPSLRQIFSNNGKMPPQTIHIVDEVTLKQLAGLHPYNNNLFKENGRDDDFPELLRVGEPGGLYFIITDSDQRFIASLTVRPIDDQPESLEFAQISIQKNYMNMSLASQLLDALKNYLNKERRDVERLVIYSYLSAGHRWIRPKLLEMSPHFKAHLVEQDSWTQQLKPLRHLKVA